MIDWPKHFVLCNEKMRPVLDMVQDKVAVAVAEGHVVALIQNSEFDKIIPDFFSRELFVEYLKFFAKENHLVYCPSDMLRDADSDKIMFSWAASTVVQ